jgi:hypothetical protein
MGYDSCNDNASFFDQIDSGTFTLGFNYQGAFKNSSWLGYSPAANYPCQTAKSGFYSAPLYPNNTVTFADSGGTAETITLANAATASLYCYTPYVGPISTTGYSGSYNFVYYYQLWFGSTYTSYQYAWSSEGQGAYLDSGYTQEFSRGQAHATVAPGGTAYFQIQALNNGYATWSQSIAHLGTTDPTDRCSVFANNSWLSCSRIAMQQSSVIPGATGTFDFSITAPQTPGTYVENFNLVAEGITWMNGPGLYFVINVVTPNSGSASTVIPNGTTMTPGTVELSPDGNTALAVQNDGNVVLYIEGKAVWDTNTYGDSISKLVMQSDGNLVLYNTSGVAVWNASTYGNSGDHLAVQSDGNLVVYSSSNQPLWNSSTYGIPNGFDYVTESLGSPGVLFPGQQLSTADRKHVLDFQSDGNLVLYSSGTATWSTGTNGKSAAELYMQPDGNLVIYNTAGQPLWNSNTYGQGNSTLIMQTDGNLVTYNSAGRATWNSGTYGK